MSLPGTRDVWQNAGRPLLYVHSAGYNLVDRTLHKGATWMIAALNRLTGAGPIGRRTSCVAQVAVGSLYGYLFSQF